MVNRPRSRAALGAALVAAALCWPTGGRGVAQMAGPGGGGGAPPPPPPPSFQCFEILSNGFERCHDTWCEQVSFLFFTWTECDDEQLDGCLDTAQDAYLACMEALL